MILSILCKFKKKKYSILDARPTLSKMISNFEKKFVKEKIKHLGIHKNDFHSQTLKP
jgi:hypothetical protein